MRVKRLLFCYDDGASGPLVGAPHFLTTSASAHSIILAQLGGKTTHSAAAPLFLHQPAQCDDRAYDVAGGGHERHFLKKKVPNLGLKVHQSFNLVKK